MDVLTWLSTNVIDACGRQNVVLRFFHCLPDRVRCQSRVNLRRRRRFMPKGLSDDVQASITDSHVAAEQFTALIAMKRIPHSYAKVYTFCRVLYIIGA
jgi:hypothetical protein